MLLEEYSIGFSPVPDRDPYSEGTRPGIVHDKNVTMTNTATS